METAQAVGASVDAADIWKDDLATLLGVETMYARAVWIEALSVIETWEDREEMATIILRTSGWLYPPSFARVLASVRNQFRYHPKEHPNA